MYAWSNYGRSFYALGLMQKNLGKQDEAKASFKRAGELDPQFAGLANEN